MTWGVRARITSISTLAVLVVLGTAGLSLATAQRAVLTDSVDEVLDRHADTIVGLIRSDSLGAVIAEQGDEEAFAIVSDPSSRRVAATADAPTTAVHSPPDGVERVSIRPDGAEVDFRARVSLSGESTILVATPLDDVDESVSVLTRGLAIAVPLTSLLFAVLVWILVGRVLRPVERIRRRVAMIGDSSLDQRVPEPDTGDEISRLAHTMNDMLDRLEAAARRQRGFIGDASHELRTPLARIRAQLEVDSRHPDGADLAASHLIVLGELARVQGLVDDLLTLATADEAGRGAGESRAIVDLDDIVLGEIAAVRDVAHGRIDSSGVSAAQVHGRAERLARVVRNLLDNAIDHGAGRITVTLGEFDDRAVLSVSDEGPGIAADYREAVFERFTRLDESRSAARGGTGLGLAIARSIARQHGGDLRLDPTSPEGATFVLSLPRRGVS